MALEGTVFVLKARTKTLSFFCVKVLEGGALEVYLKEEQPGDYVLYCTDNNTSEPLDKVYVGCKYVFLLWVFLKEMLSFIVRYSRC